MAQRGRCDGVGVKPTSLRRHARVCGPDRLAGGHVDLGDDTVVVITDELGVGELLERAVVHRDGEVAHVLANRCDHVDVGIAGEASNCGELAVDASRRLAVGTRRRVGDGIGGEDHGTWDAGLADLGDGQVHAYAACSGAGEVAVGHGVVGVVVVGRLDSSVVGVGAIDVLGGEGEVAQRHPGDVDVPAVVCGTGAARLSSSLVKASPLAVRTEARVELRHHSG
mmetsp:Transcript_35782/g.84459  ORF Transcript_35782/g.84459 Transcript_35782/m.84459 type:complete len:224 (+) Transcript_35782:1507-2178(+)